MKNIKKIFVLKIIFISSLYSSQKEQFKVVSFNIDTNIARAEEGYARDSHPEWRVNARMPKIQSSLQDIINQHSPDVIQLQEGRAFTNKFNEEVDSISPLVQFLSKQGYQVAVQPYNPTDRAFSYITALKRKFTIDKQEFFYLTKTPDKVTDHSLPLQDVKDNNYGEEWERCIYSTSFHDKQGRKYRVRNVHLGIGELHRKKACEMLVNDSQQQAEENPDTLEVTTGDFNTFPDWGGPAQLEIMRKNGILQEVTERLTLSTGKAFNSTFIAFPYDFGADEKRLGIEFSQAEEEQRKIHPEYKVKTLAAALAAMPSEERRARIGQIFNKECKAICGHLDRVYQRGFSDASVKLLLTPQFSDFKHDDVNEETVKDFIMRHYHEGPAFASDHQPLLVTCEIPEKK